MPIKAFILGLPRSATTYVYKVVYNAFKRVGDVIGVFEPTNYEVVNNIFKGIKHVHDTEGEVPYDYDRLPRELLVKIHENSRWLKDWTENETPSEEFLGMMFPYILRTLDVIPSPIVIKDVHAWVRAKELVTWYPHTKFIFTAVDYETWFDRMKKRFRTFRNPLDKAGVGKFFRYFSGGVYLRELSEMSLRIETSVIWSIYESIINYVSNKDNVYVVRYKETITKDQVHNLIKWVISG